MEKLAEQDRQTQAKLRKLKLEQEATGEELGRIRWQATLDPDNPDPASFAEWGRTVGVAVANVRQYALAYERLQNEEQGSSSDFAACLFEVRTSAETAATATMVADALDKQPQSALADQRAEVNEIKAATREVVEAKQAQGIETTFEEELPAVAAPIVERMQTERLIDSVERATPSPEPKVDGEDMILLERDLVAALDALASAKHRLASFDFERIEMGRVHSRIDRIIENAAELHRVIDPTRADLDAELAVLVQESDG